MDDGLIRVMDILGVNSLTHWQAEDGRHAYRVKHVVEYDAENIHDADQAVIHEPPRLGVCAYRSMGFRSAHASGRPIAR